jgi:drug/metabolite transporter (DMT)-like permease
MPWLDTILALALWGLWAFLPKLAGRYLSDAWSSVLYQYGGSIVAIVLLALRRGSALPEWSGLGALYAGLAGVAATGGMLFYYRACRGASVSLVASTTALYPLIAVALAWPILGETLSVRQWVGVGAALGAVFLLSGR